MKGNLSMVANRSKVNTTTKTYFSLLFVDAIGRILILGGWKNSIAQSEVKV